MVRVLVVGVGSIGGLIGGLLARVDGLDVHLAARGPRNPLQIFTAGGCETPSTTWHTEPAEAGVFDWVVLATKIHDTNQALAWVREAVDDRTSVVVAQNGVDQVERLAGVVSATRVIPAIVTHGAFRRAPGEVVHSHVGRIAVPNNAVGQKFCSLGAESGLCVETVQDFDAALWTKLAYNVVGNSLTAITRLPVREIAAQQGLRGVARALVEECRSAASVEGVNLPVDLAEEILASFSAYSPIVKSSMLQDVEAGRPMEHHAISGAVVRVGLRAGHPTPYSAMATQLLDAIESDHRTKAG